MTESGERYAQRIMSEVEAVAEYEKAAEFGQMSGECGICGRTLDDFDLEAGLCHPHAIEFYELSEEGTYA